MIPHTHESHEHTDHEISQAEGTHAHGHGNHHSHGPEKSSSEAGNMLDFLLNLHIYSLRQYPASFKEPAPAPLTIVEVGYIFEISNNYPGVWENFHQEYLFNDPLIPDSLEPGSTSLRAPPCFT